VLLLIIQGACLAALLALLLPHKHQEVLSKGVGLTNVLSNDRVAANIMMSCIAISILISLTLKGTMDTMLLHLVVILNLENQNLLTKLILSGLAVTSISLDGNYICISAAIATQFYHASTVKLDFAKKIVELENKVKEITDNFKALLDAPIAS